LGSFQLVGLRDPAGACARFGAGGDGVCARVVHVGLFVCMYWCVYVYKNVFISVCMYLCMGICIYPCLNMYARMYVCVRKCVCTYTLMSICTAFSFGIHDSKHRSPMLIIYMYTSRLIHLCVCGKICGKRTKCVENHEIWNKEFSHILGKRISEQFGKMCRNICTPECFS